MGFLDFHPGNENQDDSQPTNPLNQKPLSLTGLWEEMWVGSRIFTIVAVLGFVGVLALNKWYFNSSTPHAVQLLYIIVWFGCGLTYVTAYGLVRLIAQRKRRYV